MKNTALAGRPASFDVHAVRRRFPILARTVRGRPLAYLDNGASAQRPDSVIEAVDDYERRHHANIHRGVHTLSQEATSLYETARDRLVRFINALERNKLFFLVDGVELGSEQNGIVGLQLRIETYMRST